MAKLYFKYGTMNSGKSLALITTAHNYEEQDKNVLIYTSDLDSRSGIKKVASRIGVSRDAEYLPREDVMGKLLEDKKSLPNLHAILVDESQFLTKEQVIELSIFVDTVGIPVICYGLKNDFQNNLFEGTAALLAFADKIEELKTVCTVCDKKATMNLRTSDGKAVYHGEQIQIGDEEYIPVCRKCYTLYDIIKEESGEK